MLNFSKFMTLSDAGLLVTVVASQPYINVDIGL